ncbi:hypothetical protein [Cohnella sp. 56]|uniref:hypothetical protein n=1 Tax=Cohnella sp. 56 TaxID=3113722 RepID=UPI0030E7BD27
MAVEPLFPEEINASVRIPEGEEPIWVRAFRVENSDSRATYEIIFCSTFPMFGGITFTKVGAAEGKLYSNYLQLGEQNELEPFFSISAVLLDIAKDIYPAG